MTNVYRGLCSSNGMKIMMVVMMIMMAACPGKRLASARALLLSHLLDGAFCFVEFGLNLDYPPLVVERLRGIFIHASSRIEPQRLVQRVGPPRKCARCATAGRHFICVYMPNQSLF